MQSAKHWLARNWLLKVISLGLAILLWAVVSQEASSEIGLEVPLEYRNIPPQMEITGDTAATVEVRLRGSRNVIKDITAKNVAATIDLGKMKPGEKVVAVSQQNVQAPFGAEVVRVNPSTVRFTLERTLVKTVAVEPALWGHPAEGYEVGAVSVVPKAVQVEGPESRVTMLSAIPTVAIRLEGKQSSIEQTVDLDVPDPHIRLQRPSPVHVSIEIHRKR
jgi:YbbR domain-containing protein